MTNGGHFDLRKVIIMSSHITALQKKLNVPTDGKLGPTTLDALLITLGALPNVANDISTMLHTRLHYFAPEQNLDNLLKFLAVAATTSKNFSVFEMDGSKYEGNKLLGNLYQGDGKLFRPRGIFHITGRNQYAYYTRMCGLNLINNPDNAADPAIATMLATIAWHNTYSATSTTADHVAFYKVITRTEDKEVPQELHDNYAKLKNLL